MYMYNVMKFLSYLSSQAADCLLEIRVLFHESLQYLPRWSGDERRLTRLSRGNINSLHGAKRHTSELEGINI